MVALSKTIKFTDNHIEKIRHGEKETTMRTVKRDHVYQPGTQVTVEGSDLVLEVTDMRVVRFGNGLLEVVSGPSCDQDFIYLGLGDVEGSTLWPEVHPERALERLAEFEGFDSHEEMVAWFQGDNPMGLEYDLPQPFFLYRFRMAENGGGL